jgi:hypothetical protein
VVICHHDLSLTLLFAVEILCSMKILKKLLRAVLFLVLFGVLALGVTVGGVFYMQHRNKDNGSMLLLPGPSIAPTLAPKEQWKTYTNTTYHYSFSYPPTYQVIQSDENGGESNQVDTSCCIKLVYGKKRIFSLLVIPEEKTLEENKKQLLTDNSSYVAMMEDSTFAGQSAISFLYSSEHTTNVIKDKLRYSFNMGKDDTLAKEILKTFTFTQ